MGNTIKNYERKKRREQKQAQREVNKIIFDTIAQRVGVPNTLMEKEREIFDFVNNLN